MYLLSLHLYFYIFIYFLSFFFLFPFSFLFLFSLPFLFFTFFIFLSTESLRRNAFAHRRFYTEAFTRKRLKSRRFYAQKLVHRCCLDADAFRTQKLFRQKLFRIKTLLDTGAFLQKKDFTLTSPNA